MNTTTTTTTSTVGLAYFFNVLTLSIPILNPNKPNYKSAIVSSVYLEDLKINNKFLNRMLNLNLRKMVLVWISENFDYSDEFSIEEIKYGAGITSIKIVKINTHKFFSYDGLEYFFSDNRSDNFEVVYVFHNINWKDICVLFATSGIDISGGSNSKKHLLSPHQYRLAQFLLCLEGSSASAVVSNSFHKSRTIKDKKWGDYSTKTNQQFIIDFAKTNEALKAQLLNNEPFIPKSVKEFYEIDSVADPAERLINNNNSNKSDQSNLSTKKELVNELKNHKLSDSINLITKINKFKENDNNKAAGSRTSKFHTSAYQLKPNNLSLEKSPLPINSSLNKNKSSKIGEYLELIKELIDETINSDEIKRHEIQLKLENNWVQLIENKLSDEKFLINNYQNMFFSKIHSAKVTLDTMSENNYLNKKFPKLKNELNKIDFLILTFSLCISLYSWSSYNAIAIKIGKDILYSNYKIKYYNNKEHTSIISFDDYKKLLDIDTTFFLKLGDFFMSILQQFPHDIFIRKVKIASFYNNEPYSLEINKEYLEDIKKNLIINPNTLPMLCKPIEWSKTNYGGYLLNKNKGEDIITKDNEYAHKVDNKESIYKSVNYLNSLKFGINTKLLNYLLSAEGSYILEIIEAEDKLQRTITLNIAEIYKNTYFYLNTHTDWRGRIYTQSFYISYQAGDLSSALLDFWEGESLTDEGKVFLYIYGANNHNENNISKTSYTDRLNWVKKNYDKIINLDKDLILSANNPFIFTAFCLNMKEIHFNPNAIIKTPVFLDATCNGIQHLAAIMKDVELGIQTNLIESTYNNKPKDIYSTLLDPINKAINKYGLNNLEHYSLSQVKLSRKEVKTSIMTKVYNVTTFGISHQLQSQFKTLFNNDSKMNNNNLDKIKDFNNNVEQIERDLLVSFKTNKIKTRFICQGKNGKNVILSKKDIYKIATIINDQIFVCFPSLNNIYNYFIDITNIINKLGIPLTWITPSGLIITQHYLKRKKKIISVSILGKTKKLVLRENDSKKDNAKQIQAIIPNIIHSLDASHLTNLIKTAFELNFKPLITIHDCFGTLPNRMGELDFMVKKEFILIYSNSNFLNNFHKRFIQSITDNQYKIKDKNYIELEPNELIEIPLMPKLGELDIENIINSKYMIS